MNIGKSVSCQDAGGGLPDRAGAPASDAFDRAAGDRKDTDYGTDCQRVRDRACFLYYYAPHETERSRPSVYPKRYIWGKRGFHYGVYDERNYRECV